MFKSKKVGLFLLVCVMTLNLVGVMPVLASPSQPGEPFIRNNDVIDINPMLVAQEAAELAEIEAMMQEAGIASEAEIQATQMVTPAYKVGDVVTWFGYDTVNAMHQNFFQTYYQTDYTVKYIGDYCEIWVQNDLKYYNADGTLNQLHPDGKDPEYVTDARLKYLSDVCNERIRPTDVKFFGNYASRPGTDHRYITLLNARFGTHLSYLDTDHPQRIVILVSNVRDDNYYDPIASSSFIAGFHSSSFNLYGNRSFITIDSKQWNHRVGNSGHPTRAYAFDSTIAHEMQHLIHRDNDGFEETWLNEGMSGYAEFLNGYWLTQDLGDRTEWQNWPENSLTLWDDQADDLPGTSETLTDYQLVNAFFAYTSGKIGGAYTRTASLTARPDQGIMSINAMLEGTGVTFADLFRDFRRDMLHGGYTNDAQPVARWHSDYLDEYVSPLEIAEGKGIQQSYLGELRDNLDSQAYHSAGVPLFGTDFLEVCWSQPIAAADSWKVTLEADQAPQRTAWSSVAASSIYTPSGAVSGDVLRSGHDDLTDNFVVFGPFNVAAGDVLSFDQYYNIEETWDYGFVQVTTDTVGSTGWVSLDMAGMITETDPGAHNVIIENVPGFSGFSDGWVTATTSLSAYAGQEIWLAFRYSSDWGTGGNDDGFAPGWAIDNLKVGQTNVDLTKGYSIQEMRNAGNKFDFEFLTWKNGHAVDVNNVYVAKVLSQTQTIEGLVVYELDLAPYAKNDEGFNQAGESGVLMVSTGLDVFDDLINGGMQARPANYKLLGVPPSICTSDVAAYGVGGWSDTRVRAGELITISVHLDNLGSAAEITTTGPAMIYAGLEVPANTSYITNSAIGGGQYVANLSTIAATFPAVPGIYWSGSVDRVHDFAARFSTFPDLDNGTAITATVHYASAASATPDQHFVDEDTRVRIEGALMLSGLKADKNPVMPASEAQFTAVIVNKSSLMKPVVLVANNPADATFVSVTGATVSQTSGTQVTVTKVVSPYASSGLTNITFSWKLGSSYETGDIVTSTMQLIDTTTGESVALNATTTVGADVSIYLPLVMRKF